MRIAVFTDVHGNLPALEAALLAIAQLGCDAIYHTGDAIAIGPYSAECLDRLLHHVPRIQCVMGNHDAWFAFGLPGQSAGLTEGEAAHQRWVHASLNTALRAEVARWPYCLEENLAGVRCAFQHYGLLASSHEFAPIVAAPSAMTLAPLFAHSEAALIFYGHNHEASDVQGRDRYVNPGSLGCYCAPVARFVTVDLDGNGGYTLAHHAVVYDDTELLRAFEERNVPERAFVRRVFLPR
jgi:predicted phosphodiesterase